MSLPDTIFIFLLALIIFGPKKLPEMAKQLGRLMGEFRRASNDFKFQIEEELRQSDIADRQKNLSTEPVIQPPSSQLAAITQPPAIVAAAGAEPRSLPEETAPAETSLAAVPEASSNPEQQSIAEPTEVETTRG